MTDPRQSEYTSRSIVKRWLRANARPAMIDDLIDTIESDASPTREQQLDLVMLRELRKDFG